jgi:DNA-binding transcriptional LysR family regulator
VHLTTAVTLSIRWSYTQWVEMLHLRYFVAVAEELNFTRAAARLHLSASPLSRRIKDLEGDLGRELFVRSHHKVELTAAGEALLPVARGIIERFDAVPALVRDAAGPRSHTVVLGIAPEVSPALRTTVLRALAAAHPDVAVRLQPAPGGELVRGLQAGKLDFALVNEPVPAGGIGSVRLECRPVGVVVARGAGFDGRTSVRPEELAHLPYAGLGNEAALPPVADVLNRAGVARCAVAEGNDVGGLAHVVATGQAFTIIGCGDSVAGKAFAGEPVTVLAVDGISAGITTVAAWRQDRLQAGGILVDLVATLRALAARPTRVGVTPIHHGGGHRTGELG